MVDGKMKERSAFVNPTLVSKVGIGEATKENKSTKESYNSCYCEALCYFLDINNVHNVVSTFLFYVILFFSTGQFPSGQFASYKLSLVEFFFGKVLF